MPDFGFGVQIVPATTVACIAHFQRVGVDLDLSVVVEELPFATEQAFPIDTAYFAMMADKQFMHNAQRQTFFHLNRDAFCDVLANTRQIRSIHCTLGKSTFQMTRCAMFSV